MDREPDIQGYTVRWGSYVTLHIEINARGHMPVYAALVGCGFNRNPTPYSAITLQSDYTPPYSIGNGNNVITFPCDFQDYVLDILNP